MSTEPAVRVRGWRRRLPAIWGAYGAVYVAVFAARGQLVPAVVTAALVVATALGLLVEVRGPRAARPRLLGWEQDERHRLLHQQAMALVGYAVIGAAAVGGFVAFVVDPDLALWPMLALAGLVGVYGVGLAIYQRRV
jgi:hypothetical protein